MSTPLGLKIVLDKTGIHEDVARIVRELGDKHKIQLGFGLSQTEITNMKTQIETLQKQFAQTFAGGIDPIKGVGNALDGLKDKVRVLNGVQVKLVGDEQTQMIQRVKTSLIETQKIVTDFKTGNVTTTLDYNYEKGKKLLYGELIKLQKNEFDLKGQMIGKEGLIKSELEKQLSATKSLQVETTKLINANGLRDKDKNSDFLKERKILTSDLAIAQEKYNQSLANSMANAQAQSNANAKQRELDIEKQLLKTMQEEEKTANTIQDAIARTIQRREQEAKVLEKTQSLYANKVKDSGYKDNYGEAISNLKTIGELQRKNLSLGDAQKTTNQGIIATLEERNKKLYQILDSEQKIAYKALESKNNSKVDAKATDTSQVKIYKDIEASIKNVYDWKAKIKKAEDDGNVALQKYYTTQLKVEQSNLKGLYTKKETNNLTSLEKELAIQNQIKQAIVDIKTANLKQEKATNLANYSEILSNLKQINNLEKDNRKSGEATREVNQGIIAKLQERNKALYTTLDLEQKIGVQSLRSQNSNTNKATELDRVKALGTLQSANVQASLFTGSSKDIDKFINGLMVGKEKFKEFTREARGTDSEVIKFTTTTKISGKESLIQAYSIDKLTGAMYKLDGATKNTEAHTATFAERLKHAFNNITSFVTVSAFFYQVVNSMRAGVASVIEMDTAINALKIDMMGAKESAFDSLTEGSMRLSLQLGTTIKDVTDIMAIYANANSTAQEVLEKTAPSAILSNISGMTGLNASDAIQSVLLVFDEFKNSSDSIAKQSEKISDTFASVASKLNLNFKTGLTSMSSAVKVSGAVINEAGMDLNVYSAIVGNLAEKTRLSGETIGTSMKTIVSRISRAKTGDATADEISNADKAFASLGINIRKGNGEFEDLDVTLTALSKKWGGLTAQQRSYIAEESAGVRQKAVFINMMNDYAVSTKLATEALEEQGIASQKNDIYLESTQAKILQFKTVVASAWIKMLSSDFLNVFVTGATKLVEVFFDLEKMIGIATLSMMLFKGKAIAGAIESMILFTMYTREATVATTALSKATALWNAVVKMNPVTKIAMGIIAILGVMAIASGVSEARAKKAQKASEELAKATKESTDSNNDTISFLQGEGKAYDELSQKTNKTVEEQEKLKSIKSQIAEMFPELITGYSDETGEIEIQKKSTSELIEIMREKNRVANDTLLAGGGTGLEATVKGIEDAQEQINKYKEKMSGIKDGGKNIGQGDIGYKNTLDGIAKQLENQNLSFEKRILLEKKQAEMLEEYRRLQNDVSLEYDKQKQAVANLQPYINAVISDYKNLSTSQKQLVSSKVVFTANDLLKFDKGDFTSLREQIVKSIEDLKSNKSIVKLEEIMQVKSGELDSKKMEEYFENIIKASEELKIKPLELTQMFPLQSDPDKIADGLREYQKKITALMDKEQNPKKKAELKAQADQVSNIMIVLKVDSKQVDGAIGSLDELQQSVEELEKSYDESIDKMTLYAKVLKEIDTNGHLSSVTTKEIAKSHRHLAPYLNDTKVLYQKIQEEMKKETDVAEKTYNDILEMDKDFMKTIATNKDLLAKLKAEGYSKDFENAKTLAEAKIKLEAETIKIIAGAWADYFDAQGNVKWNDFAKDQGFVDEDGSSPTESRAQLNQVKNLQGMQDAIAKKNKENADRLNAFKPTIDFKGLATDLENNTKVGKDSSSETKTSTSEALENNPFDALLNKQNKSLSDQDLLIDSIKTNIQSLISIGSDNSRQKALEQQNKLYDEQVDKIAILKRNIAEDDGSNGIKKAENFLKSNWSSLKNVNITSMSNDDLMAMGSKIYPERTFKGEDSDKESKRYNDGKQLYTDWVNNLDKMRTASEKNRQDLIKAEEALTPIIAEKWQMQFDKWENIWSKRIDVSGDIQDKIDLLETEDPTNTKEKTRLTNELIKQEKLVRQGYVDANAGLSKQLLTLKEDTLEWQIINNQIEIYNENIDDSDKSLANLNKSLKDIEEENTSLVKESQEKIKEAIKKRYEEEQKLAKETSDRNKKIREEEHKNIIDKLNKEKKAYEDFYDTKLKDLDRESGENQYSNKIDDLIKEKMTLQKEYDSLLMDDSLGAKARREDIKDELAKVQKSIEGEQFDRNIELQKNNIADLADAQSKSIENQIDEENDLYDQKEKEFEKELERIEKKYEKLLSEENLYRESAKAMMDNQYVTQEGHIMTLTALITEFTDKWADGLGVVGDKIKSEILDNLAKAQESIGANSDASASKIKAMENGSVYFDGNVVSLGVINSKEGMEKYKSLLESAKNVYVKGYDGTVYNNKTGEKASFSEGGVIDYTGEADVHGSPNNAEVVFNSKQALGLYRFVTKLPSESLSSNSQQISGAPRLPQSVTSNNTSEITLSIGNLVNIDGNVDKSTLLDVEGISKKVLTNIQKELNKKGFFKKA